LEKSSIFGAVESTKSVSDLYSPIAGVVTEVNSSVESEPEIINSSPYDNGWMIKINPENIDDLDTLLDSKGYKDLVDGK
jgi:Glycine cleavage system H protein (lipoate-binding)